MIPKVFNFNYKLIIIILWVLFYKAWKEKPIKQLCRQIKSLERTLPLFNVAIICSKMKQSKLVHEAVQRCFDHVEYLYFYDKSTSLTGIKVKHKLTY